MVAHAQPKSRAGRGKVVTILGQEFDIEGRGDFFDSLPSRGAYHDPLFDVFAMVVRPDAICLDVGANIGLMTMVLARLAPSGMVTAIEPDDESLAYLGRNIRTNRLDNVTAVRTLLAASRTRKIFIRNIGEPGCSASAPAEIARGIAHAGLEHAEMACATLDDVVRDLQLERLDFIKIDCEGADLEVLEGARETLARFRPAVILEFNAHCIMNIARVNPPDALDRIMQIFPQVRRIAISRDFKGYLVPIDDRYVFMHDHLMKRGSREDLLGTF
ncbi:MAG TPA: FkbM family methyltransferase [Stellaceae bacterium]|nr:FkbM family methyltransferase [Stellaceae bacterium]